MRIRIPGVDERPPIHGDLSNAADVVDYYKDHGPNATFQRAFHVLMDKLVDPYVVYAPGIRDNVRDHIDSDDPTVFAMTHHSWFDPSDDAAALQQEKEVFDPIIGKFVIPARMDYFDKPVIGSIIAPGGAKPMVRKKDLAKYYASLGFSKEEIDVKLAANGDAREEVNNPMQQLMVEMAIDGYVYASYIEGTRNRGDQLKLQKVRNGILDLLMAMEPSQRERTKIILFSHDFGGRLMRRFLTPTIYINMIDAPADPNDVNELLQDTLQDGLFRARENRRKGAPLSPLGKVGCLAAVAAGAAAADKLSQRSQ